MTQHARTLAYLDPGSAGVILQIIGGGVVALVVTLKLYGKRLLRFLHLRKDDAEPATRPRAS